MTNSPDIHLRLSKPQRLRTTSDFKRCYDGARAGDDHLLVFGVANDLGHCRLGVSVSKKHGNAVARNRKKRLLREAFRLVQHDLPPEMDLVVVPRQRPDSDLNDFQSSLQRLAKKVARKIAEQSRSKKNRGAGT